MNSEQTIVRINHYTVIRQLGVGSMGTTYLVRNDENGQIFAIKVLNRLIP
jgi:serine/threonine protein kinase